jgi:hypothetical protein
MKQPMESVLSSEELCTAFHQNLAEFSHERHHRIVSGVRSWPTRSLEACDGCWDRFWIGSMYLPYSMKGVSGSYIPGNPFGQSHRTVSGKSCKSLSLRRQSRFDNRGSSLDRSDAHELDRVEELPGQQTLTDASRAYLRQTAQRRRRD